MSLERIKKSLVILDQSLDTLENVIEQREHAFKTIQAAHQEAEDALTKQIDMFNENNTASPKNNRNHEEAVQKLDHVISEISQMLKTA